MEQGVILIFHGIMGDIIVQGGVKRLIMNEHVVLEKRYSVQTQHINQRTYAIKLMEQVETHIYQ